MTEAATADNISADDWAAAMAEQGAEPAAGAADGKVQVATPPIFEQFTPGAVAGAHDENELILDIPVQLTVELGRTKIAIKNLLQLAQGSVVELDGGGGEPQDVVVYGGLKAQGEVVVV